MGKNKVLCCIFNHNKNDNSVLWLERLSKHYDTFIIDSGSDTPINDERVIKFDNIYWGGLYSESSKLMKNGGYEWLLIICDDILIDDSNFEKLVFTIDNVIDTSFIGEYQPSTLKGSHNVWSNNFNKGTNKIRITNNIEGWMFLVRSDVVKKVDELGIDFRTEMKLGWGIDVLLSYYSYKIGHCNVVDDRVVVTHPMDKAGYDAEKACSDMNKAFSKIGMSYGKLLTETIEMAKNINKTNGIKFISYNNLFDDIRSELRKIPKDVAGVVGVPRSGMLPSTMISEYLNVGLTTVDEFVKGVHRKSSIEKIFNKHGNRKLRNVNSNKILIVDDTCYNGKEISKLRKIFEEDCFKKFEIVYLVAYLEGDAHLSMPDIYLKDIRKEAKNSSIGVVLYEWNIFSNPVIIEKTLFDLDGVLCVDPPDERNSEEYVKYINNPTPLYIPSTKGKLSICTYRLGKYKEETSNFLKSIGFSSFKLFMYNAETYEKRGEIEPWKFKGYFYKNRPEYKLFVESNDFQAKKINEISGKPVYCVDSNKMYN